MMLGDEVNCGELATEIVGLTCDQLQDLAKAIFRLDPVAANILLAELDLVMD